MSKYQNRVRKQVKIARLEIVAELYKRGYSLRKIRTEVMSRLDLKSYSLQTVHKDIQSLLEEWRENRLKDTDALVQIELERIDEITRECWASWEKSKEDRVRTVSKRKGVNVKGNTIIQSEKTETEIINIGDVSFLSEIGKQSIERRKLLGLYAPDKLDITDTPKQIELIVKDYKEKEK